MSLNAAHELIATRNAARAYTDEHDRSKNIKRREDYFSSSGPSRGGRQYDDEQDDDWWAKELEGDLEQCRRHGFSHRNDRGRHRAAQDHSRERHQDNDVGGSTASSRE
ncbi:hypothetical protein KEM54_005932, partial [Ascosphaera aggregata]